MNQRRCEFLNDGDIVKIRDQITGLRPVSRDESDHDYFNVYLKSRSDLEKTLSKSLRDASLLVVGCGYLYPDVLLYSTCAKKVVGIDVINSFYRDGLLKTFLSSLRQRRDIKGWFFALNACVRKRIGVKGRYYGRFERYLGFKMRHKELQLISFNGVNIPFPENTFDVVISNAVLEHVMGISAAIKEMARVTNATGINYHLYHNYYSFSGNHKPYGLNKKYPWGHLRGLIETNPKHLNKVKIYELEKIFLSYFSDVEVFPVDRNHCKRGIDAQFEWEQEALFQRYRGELEKKYPVEMLLSRGFLIVGKKKSR